MTAAAFNFDRITDKRHVISLIDGPNMSNLGRRSKTLYGPIASLTDLQEYVKLRGERMGVEVEVFASNHEGEILEYIHESAERVDGYIINPAGLTVAGMAVPHALLESGRPSVEVHFANTEAGPDTFRGGPYSPVKSVFTPLMTGKCTGMRQYSYVAALTAMVLSLDDDDFLGQEPLR